MQNNSNGKNGNNEQGEASVPEHLSKLIEGFSTQTKTATQYWLALAVISVLVIIPSATAESIKLPFELGAIKQSDFYPFAAFLISVLIIGFGSSHVQAIRTRTLIQRIIDESESKYLSGRIHLRDFVDSTVSPSLTRTAPLAQYLRGKYQFYPESEKSSLIMNIFSASIYLLLKIAAFLVVYLIPAFSLYKSMANGHLSSLWSISCGIPNIFFLFVSVIAVLILLELMFSEAIYIITSIRQICHINAKKSVRCG